MEQCLQWSVCWASSNDQIDSRAQLRKGREYQIGGTTGSNNDAPPFSSRIPNTKYENRDRRDIWILETKYAEQLGQTTWLPLFQLECIWYWTNSSLTSSSFKQRHQNAAGPIHNRLKVRSCGLVILHPILTEIVIPPFWLVHQISNKVRKILKTQICRTTRSNNVTPPFFA